MDGYKIIEINKLSNRPVYGFREINNQIKFSSNILMKPIQKILFGSPGTGKSYQIREIAQQQLNIQIDEFTKTSLNIVKAVFHPEYSYADFMGKLLPFTQGNSVIYKFYPGHFSKILGKAYKSLIEGKNENYLLVIDELNRGNSAAIFGNIFQLLDRESDGWSSYEIDISEMELVGLFQAMKLSFEISSNNEIRMQFKENGGYIDYSNALKNQSENLKNDSNNNGAIVCNILLQCQIKLPPNLSIIATINTSDESIYYLDTAFKRRWDWEFVNAPVGEFDEDNIPKELLDVELVINEQDKDFWCFYLIGINELIKSNYQTIRRIEDKMIGWWFIKPENEKIELQQVKDKLMFYLWDSVFARDKKPLESFLTEDENSPVKLALYSDFLNLTEVFLKQVYQEGEKLYKGQYYIEKKGDNLTKLNKEEILFYSNHESYVDAPVGKFDEDDVPEELKYVRLYWDGDDGRGYPMDFWCFYIVGINQLILSSQISKSKLIQWWFIKPEDYKIQLEQVIEQLFPYLWYYVFYTDKTSLNSISSLYNSELQSYQDFLKDGENFLHDVAERGWQQYTGMYYREEKSLWIRRDAILGHPDAID